MVDEKSAPFRILKPGIFPDLPPKFYHDDPCPEPSLSASGLTTILKRTPAHLFAEHPRLQPPEFAEEDDDKFTLGRGPKLSLAAARQFWPARCKKSARWNTRYASGSRSIDHCATFSIPLTASNTPASGSTRLTESGAVYGRTYSRRKIWST